MRFGSCVHGSACALLLGLTSLASLRLVFEVLIVEELLLSRRKNELPTTIDALQNAVLKLFHRLLLPNPWGRPGSFALLDFATSLFTVTFSGQGLLDPLLFTRFQVERVAFNFFDDVFLLHFSLKPAECVF
jgi:hypothetical protein